MNAVIELRAADGALAEILPQGAHLTRWLPAGNDENALFLSGATQFAAGIAVRGGVPVIFPQFAGEGPLVKHGFARTALWSLVQQTSDQARFRLVDTDASRALWPHRYSVELIITIGGKRLQLALVIDNSGDTAMPFTAALHTYLRVADIAQVKLEGLQGLRYRDSAAGSAGHLETAASLAIIGEVDRIYFDAPERVLVSEPGRNTEVSQQGFTDTVVWNPGPAKAAAMADMEADGWRRMLCVEAAVVGRPVVLQPGERWSGSQTLIVD